MPINYKRFNICQLLRHRMIYEAIDEICKNIIPNWDISRFECELYSDHLDMKSTVSAVHDLIADKLDILNAEHPALQYLDDGQHTAEELFQIAPPTEHDCASYYILWAMISRAFSGIPLPMEAEEIKGRFYSTIKSLGINYPGKSLCEVAALRTNDHLDGVVYASDICNMLRTIKARNNAFTKRMICDASTLYVDFAKERFAHYCQKHGLYETGYRLRDGIDAHTLCFAIDSSCTERQRDYAFHRWGVFTGKPLTLRESGALCGVTQERIRQIEVVVLRNSLRDRCLLLVPTHISPAQTDAAG